MSNTSIEWAPPPPVLAWGGRGNLRNPAFDEVEATLKQRPGDWAVIARGPAVKAFKGLSTRANQTRHIEVAVRGVVGGWAEADFSGAALYARYMYGPKPTKK